MARQVPGANKEVEVYIERSKIVITESAGILKLILDGQEIQDQVPLNEYLVLKFIYFFKMCLIFTKKIQLVVGQKI